MYTDFDHKFLLLRFFVMQEFVLQLVLKPSTITYIFT